MTTRLPEDIYTYEQQALELISQDNPHAEEIKHLLQEQVKDELYDYAHTVSD